MSQLSPELFAARFTACSRTLWCVAAAIVGDPGLAEDVLQEAAVIALQKLDHFDADTSFAAWMSQIVRYVALNNFRRRSRRPAMTVDPVHLNETVAADTRETPLSLTGRVVSSTLSEFSLSGATPGGFGVLVLSTCSARISIPPLTLWIDVTPRHMIGQLPLTFDPAGRFKLTLPRSFSLPASVGTSLFFQGAQGAPSVGLSNGVWVTLRP